MTDKCTSSACICVYALACVSFNELHEWQHIIFTLSHFFHYFGCLTKTIQKYTFEILNVNDSIYDVTY